MDKLLDLARVAILGLAFVLLGVAVLEGVAQAAGHTLVPGGYSAGRLLEFAGIVMLFGIGLMVRELVEQGRRGRG